MGRFGQAEDVIHEWPDVRTHQPHMAFEAWHARGQQTALDVAWGGAQGRECALG